MKTLLICAFIVGVTLLGCGTINKSLGKPYPKLVGISAGEELGSEYRVRVDCTVLNKGASGDIMVSAILNVGGKNYGFWKSTKRVAVQENETKKVTMHFIEPFSSDTDLKGVTYTCGFR